MKYLISACLAGINCRYDGKNTLSQELKKLVRSGEAITACPEVLGGLSIPRDPCEIQVKSGKRYLISKQGKDCTEQFQKGAEETLKICRDNNIEVAILKQKSPSCGCGKIYDGSFSGKIISGNGITAELLLKNGIRVLTEEEFTNSSQA